MSVIVSANRVKWSLRQIHTCKFFAIDPVDCVVGRSITAQIILNSAKSSRTHSSFVVNVDGHLLIQDLNSANGTFVNGKKLEHYKRYMVSPGDIIGFGIPDESLSDCEKDRCTFFEVLREIPLESVKTEDVIVIDLTDQPDDTTSKSSHSDIKSHQSNVLQVLPENTKACSSSGGNGNVEEMGFLFNELNSLLNNSNDISSSSDVAAEVVTTEEPRILTCKKSGADIDIDNHQLKGYEESKMLQNDKKKNLSIGEQVSSEDSRKDSVIIKDHLPNVKRDLNQMVKNDKKKHSSDSGATACARNNILMENDVSETVMKKKQKKHSMVNGPISARVRRKTPDKVKDYLLVDNNVREMEVKNEKRKLSNVSDQGSPSVSSNVSGAKKHKIDIDQDCVLEITTSKVTTSTGTLNSTSNAQSTSSVQDQDSNTDGKKSSRNSFSTVGDASILIDITDDNDEDFSSSQIFQMSQIVKTEIEQDDNFQKIKSELAEMDYFDDEMILNPLPIDVEVIGEMSGFENTQDIRAYLESDVGENTTTPKIVNERDSGFSVEEELSFENTSNTNANKTRKAILVEPHRECKPAKLTRKSATTSSDQNGETNENDKTKRKKTRRSSETTTSALKPLSNCKVIKNELKKRRSRSNVELDKSTKESIKEERRKKLEQLEESKPKLQIDKDEKNAKSPVKIPPQSRTYRGSFLCDQGQSKLTPALKKYELRPIDLPKTTVTNGDKSRRYDLISAQSILPDFPTQVENKYNRHAKHNNAPTNFVIPKIPDVKNKTDKPKTHKPPVLTRTSHTIQAYPDKVPVVTKYLNPLMYPNLAKNVEKGPPTRRLKHYNVDDIVYKIVRWYPKWLSEQVDIDVSPPVNDPPARKIPLHFRNFQQYYDVFSKLILLEKWHYLFKGFRESTEFPRKAQIQHIRLNNDLLYIDCIYYVTEAELRKGSFFKSDDFLLMECKTRDNTNLTYMSLNFGCVQRCRRTEVSSKDLKSVLVRDLCSGTPHCCLEFTIVMRYQMDKKIENKSFILLKLMANIGGYLKQIKAVKCLADSPLCKMVLNPRAEDYQVVSVQQTELALTSKLNPRQKQVVLEASSVCTRKSSGIYCIKGPPGTGKTNVIVNIVCQVLMSSSSSHSNDEPRILLAAPSNTAVDNLLSKLVAKKAEFSAANKRTKRKLKIIRIGPESSMSAEGIQYSLTSLSQNHLLYTKKDDVQFKEAKERKENMVEFAKKYLGRSYWQELKSCEDVMITNSNVICTTLNSCVNGKLIDAVDRGLIKFTCCIIDEATQCHEVESLLPIMLGLDKFVLVGDPKQLNATIMNREAVNLGYGESLFSRIANNFISDPRVNSHDNDGSPIKILTEQYRMHPEICSFPSRQFYDGKLISVWDHSNKLSDRIKPYLVFTCEKHNDTGDYTNMDEVYLIRNLLKNIFELVGTTHHYTFGIITPYNAQKDLIIHNIKDLMHSKNNCKIVVNTVDSFQGSENDFIIISCVRSSTNSFLQNENRLNVALTRAKQVLYIIGSYTLFKECRTLYDLRDDAKNRKVLIDVKQNPKNMEHLSKMLVK